MYYIASVSFGKDSLAMLLLILNHPEKYPLNEVVFFDWGMEFQAIYNNRDKIVPLLESKGIKFTELNYETSFMYNFCERPIKKKSGERQSGYSWCGGLARWGTDRKESTIKKYYIADGRQQQGIDFFMLFTKLDHIPKVAIENPIGIMSTKYRKPDQIIEPYWFGDPFEKRTCLWLKGLPYLEPTDVVEPESRKVYASGKSMPPWYANASGKDRKKIRSKTFPGIAKAMAEQWG